MEPFFAGYKAVKPWLIEDPDEKEPGARALAEPEDARAIRRHHQVHPLRGVHDVMSDLLGRQGIRGASGHR